MRTVFNGWGIMMNKCRTLIEIGAELLKVYFDILKP